MDEGPLQVKGGWVPVLQKSGGEGAPLSFF